MHHDRHRKLASLLTSTALALTLTGCAGGNSVSIDSAVATPQTVSLSGRVMGGQQPINQASIQLYAAGNTGYGSAYTYSTGTSLLGNHVITTSASGDFNIAGDYTCPSNSTQVYIEAIGGVPIAGEAANPNIIMLAALGPCGNLPNVSFISLNELTTVASVWALAPFMTGSANIGTTATNNVGLANAFVSVNKLVSTIDGALRGPALPSGATIPTLELNTLADILDSCIHTSGGGIAGDGSACGNLFALAVSSTGAKPTDVVTAALNIAHNPTQNVTALNRLADATAPFQPILSSAPPAWTIAIQYSPTGLSAPAGIAADQSGNIWVTDTSSHAVTLLNPSGAVTGTYATGQSGTGAIAIDLNGNAWVAGNTSGTLLEVTNTGNTTTYTGGGLATINSLAIDGSGDICAVGAGSQLSVFNSSGTPISTTGYGGGGLSNGQSLAITPQ
jgi:NHL repeat